MTNIPSLPGCYLMKDDNDRILYIGKSKNLKSRVRSYFRNNNELSPRIALMIRQVFDIEYIVTDTESEALNLESNLIKANQPYFNILLKDDKKYPYICITWSEEYPRIFITRRRRERKHKDKYYGPYVDVTSLRNTLRVIKKSFPIRQRLRPLYKEKTCLNYSIGRCPGVCQNIINPEEYQQTIKRIAMIFQGRTEELRKILEDKMYSFSDKLEYEKANIIKQQLEGISKLTYSQKITDPDSTINRDVIASASNATITCFQIFQIRSGKLVARLGYTLDTNGLLIPDLLQKVIQEHYSKLDSVEIPGELLLSDLVTHKEIVEEWLSELSNRKVRVIIPKRSNKARLINLVERNAQIELTRLNLGIEMSRASLEEIVDLFDLPFLPKRIEGYDISHIQGSNAVGSQVVFINGVPAKNNYRKYIIKDSKVKIGHSDDYISIQEVILRRFRKWSMYKQQGGSFESIRKSPASILDSELYNDFPDLILIDGGKGQLSAAQKALKKLDLEEEIKICSLAKKNEEIFVPSVDSPLDSSKDDPGVKLLRRIRDEAHRFAISFHRDRRSSQLKRSQLSEIPGMGSKRIKLLLENFNSIQAVGMATKKQLLDVPGLGVELVDEIWNYFHK